MSGDVQPRKRKDKRRKKEGDAFGASQDLSTFHKSKSHGERKTSDFIEQGERIHVQNEQGIGGNICFKIVFFCLLFALLTGIAGIVYKLSQDTTDVEPPAFEESRFAEYFAGWVDDASNDHDHDHEGAENPHSGNDENNEGEEEEEETHDSTQEDEGIHESHEDQHSEPDLLSSLFSFGGSEDAVKSEEVVDQSNQVEESREVTQEDDTGDDDDDDDDDDNGGDSDQDDENENGSNGSEEMRNNKEKEENDDKDDVHETKPIKSVKEKIRRFKFLYNRKLNRESAKNTVEKIKKKFKFEFTDEDDEEEEINDNDVEDNEENYDASQVDEEDEDDKHEAPKGTKKEAIDSKDEDEEEKVKPNARLDPLEESNGADDKNDEEGKEEETKKAHVDDLGYDEIDESYENEDLLDSVEEVHEKKEKEEPEESIPLTSAVEDFQKSNEQLKKEEKEEKPDDEERGRVVVKLGVGIALIIVAHLVLVQKWKAKGNVTPDEIISNETDVENLYTEPEPVISRRQTLVPEDVEFDDGEECSEEDGEENGDYLEEDEEAEEEEEEDYEGEEEEEEEEEESEFIDKIEPVTERHFDDKHSKLSYERPFSEKLDEPRAPLESPEDDFEELDSEEVDEEYNYDEDNQEDDEYAEEESYEEEADEEFQLEVKDPVLLIKKSVNLEEDVTPVPPPRIHKKGGQSAEDEWENPSKEVQQEEDHPPPLMDTQEDNPPQTEPVSNSLEKKVGDEEDWTFGQEFQYAEEQFENNPKEALRICEDILRKKPSALKPLILRARALDQMAERERSNAYLKQAVHAYKTLLLQEGHRLSDDTYDQLADRCISRMRFGGHHPAAIDVHKGLIGRFPNEPKHRNDLAVTYLMLNRIEPARWILNETLTRWPENGFALVHYGFIVKTADNNMEEGARLLMNGIKTKEKGVKDGMFFFHLGDALTRLGRPDEALKWYDRGVEEGLFLSRYQRSLYNVNRLKGRPWWTKEQTTYRNFFDLLEKNWKEIRREGLALLNSKQGNPFKEESENLKNTGDWRQLDLYFRGRKQANCDKAPITCSLVSSFKPASTCTRGQIKFSVMFPKTHVWPHCGPTNCRLRSHLGLVVPPKTYIRVAEEIRSWEEGKVMIFDDSFEHEVWHNGTGLRLVLIVDVWHPEITEQERRTLSPI